MQVLMLTLTRSIKAIANVLLMLLVVWIMFAILGIQLFQGRFYYCSGTDDKYSYSTERECNVARGSWTTYYFNFDNFWASSSSLIAISSLNNWEDQMYAAIDSNGVNQGPRFYSTPVYSLYFIVFIAITAFFYLNFLVGVLFLYFQKT